MNEGMYRCALSMTAAPATAAPASDATTATTATLLLLSEELRCWQNR